MARVFLGLGSNISDRLGYIRRALAMLEELPETKLVRVSSIYDTAPVGKTDQSRFLNAAAEIETDLGLEDLVESLLGVEDRCGRMRREKWGPRTLDLDVLMYGDLVVGSGHVTVPHPRMLERAFVLVPLAEIAAEIEVPGTGATVGEHLATVARDDVVRIGGPPSPGTGR